MNQITTSERSAVGAAAVPAGQYLTFMLGGEAYAIGILAIKEIIEQGQMTRVPMTPEFIRGVINLRGAVVPVIDLNARFGGRLTARERRTCIVIVEVESEDDAQDVGILVDAVNEVMDIAPSDIEPAPAFGSRVSTDFIAGMAKMDEKFVVILDLQRILASAELAKLADIAGNPQASTCSDAVRDNRPHGEERT